MTERAEALRALVAKVEAGVTWGHLDVEVVVAAPGAAASFSGSLDAVACLEAPLRQRGWEGPHVTPPARVTVPRRWQAVWNSGRGRAFADAPTEARARLIAVLRALLHEEEHP